MSTKQRSTPETDAAAKQIGRLAMQFKLREIKAAQFGNLAQAEIDRLAEIERQRDEARERYGLAQAALTHVEIERDRALAQRDRLLEALKDAAIRLEDWIGFDCECDSTHEANGAICCLCGYRAAIDEVEGSR